jgi:hypothetical protein
VSRSGHNGPVELTKQFSDDQFAKALDSWGWLDLDGKTPRFASLFGDVFLEGDDRAWWFLDTFEGELRREWDDRDAMVAVLQTEKGQDRYLMGGLALAAHERRGLRLGPAQIYAWAPPPMVTGSFAADDIKVFPFVVVVHVAGQIHAGNHS